ncbi:sensor histidine kinase [Pelagibacterium montanilacus]|uniref:sensor histidine kinase n=1 Tax=Pelagibacterium montanilacus TaxID=2185280 RepID=UPI000F8E9B63|nr:HWE histidine kinase domain-containing protein [Pelagibacterium montanilacus]
MSSPAYDTSPDRPSPKRSRKARPILFYLALLMAIILVPVLAFSGVLLQRNNIAQEEVVETFTVATTRSVLQSVEREIAGMITTLRVLATVESLADNDLARFHGHAQAALEGTGSDLILIDENFNQLLNTRVPYGSPLSPMSDPSSARRALETTDAVVSPLFWGNTAEDWVFNVMIQRPGGGGGREVVILTQNAGNLANALLTRELATGWHVALVDGTNTVIAASQDTAESGEQLFVPLVEGSGTSLRWREREVEGESYKTITQRSVLTGWYVVAWAPVSVVASPLRTTLLWLVFGGLAIAGLAALVASVVARQIARPVRGLARQARSFGAGEPIAPVDYPVKELALVSTALADAAEKRREADAEVRFLMRELAHRAKNQLSVISSMAKQTAQGSASVEQFIENFQHRIIGLARSTDLLVTQGATGIGLRELIKTQIDPFRPEDPARIVKTGPAVRLNVQAAQVLGMAAHEMATNASKYGAFSVPDGRLEVNWNRAGGARLHLSWREHLPGFVPPSDRKGFGTVVLTKMVGGTLAADVERLVHDDGIEWVFSIPLDKIDPDREHSEDTDDEDGN